ncbi:DNA-binding protein [Mesorhizobium hawassense]|uniref:DNA-binding protein n=1 Tax=Mesorhizobium hawassense TaxID=1209954 RepID=A0A330H9J1_9HYPH|nr:cold-shock protein [Mesorhizobium hawassense]RAZ83024.1 DNA-binding protein [Mesorhizobium hawassense]
MSRYNKHRKPGRNRDDDASGSPDEPFVPSSFQQPSSAIAKPVDVEVKWFNERKGYGFVKIPDGTDAFLHMRVLEEIASNGVSDGTRLTVTLEETQKGRQVARVLEIVESTSSTSTNARESTGTVKWYNPRKGYGFITPARGGRDVFVHASTLARSELSGLFEGQRVLIECRPGKKCPEVQTIRIIG